MSVSVQPTVILEHNSDLVDVVNGHVFTNLDTSPPPEYIPGKLGNCVTKTLPGFVWHKNTDTALLNNFVGDVTVFGWVKHLSGTPGFLQMAALNNINATVFNLRLNYINMNAVSLQSIIRVGVPDRTTTDTVELHTVTNTYGSPKLGTIWNFVAMSRRASDNRIRMYFNGSNGLNVTEYIRTGYSVTVKNGDFDHDNVSTCLHSFRIQSSSTSQKCVDQVGIAPAEYTAEDITYIYNNGLGRPYASW